MKVRPRPFGLVLSLLTVACWVAMLLERREERLARSAAGESEAERRSTGNNVPRGPGELR